MTNDNREQIEYWNGKAGEIWAEAQARMDVMLAPITDALLASAGVKPDMRVVDVGCGCGDTSVALARAGAHVWGIDISEPMLARARARATGIERLSFTRADAAVQPFTPEHALVVSRFGVMFFSDPVAAFANLRTALAAGGRLHFVCWQPPRLNPWVAIAGKAVQPYLPAPVTEPDPRAPGPFAFADPDHVRGILERAGFGEIEIEPIFPVLHVSDTLDEGMRFLGEIGPLARAIAELAETPRRQALAAARAALGECLTPSGLDLGAACWLVGARGR